MLILNKRRYEMKGKKYVKLLFTLALVLALFAESFILSAKTANAAEAGQIKA